MVRHPSCGRGRVVVFFCRSLETDNVAMAPLRCLTSEGIEEFGRYLGELRVRGDHVPPRTLLTDDAYSVPSMLGDVTVARRDFTSRHQFAEYIDRRFRAAGVLVDADEPGMWEWLSLFYFDAVCPPNKQGFRKPGVDGRHLLRDPDLRRRHRHLLRSPYLLWRQYSGGPDGELDLLLGYALPVHGIAATHVGERLRLMSSRGALMAASRLYYDRAARKPKRGYSDDRNGLRAYCRFVNNLPGCFDLSELSADSVVALLPRKFETWLPDERPSMRGMFDGLATMDVSTGKAVAKQLDDLLQDIQDRPTTVSQAKVRSDLFRTAVVDAYDSKCAVSDLGLRHAVGTEAARYEVEAAHIIPVARGGRDLVQNGLALNRSIHWAFDLGLLWVDDRLRVATAKEVDNDRRNRWLKQFQGRPLALPDSPRYRPNLDALRWHANNIARPSV